MIKVQAFQKHGMVTTELVDEFKFCCWDQLHKWLDKPSWKLHKCTDCKEGIK